jgi:GNAT superfamily N-acetyltransferase
VIILTVAKRNREDDSGVRTWLPDGTPILIRPIAPGDKTMLAEGLRRLSDASVRLRFLSSKPRFTAAELRYLTEVDGHDHIALVAIAGGADCFVGVARCVRLQGRPATAEMAIVVADDWQGRGVGRVLAEALSAAARDAGVRRFEALVQASNAPARALARRIATRLEEGDQGGGVHALAFELVA